MNEKTLGDYLNPEDDASFEGNKPGMGGETFQQEANTLQIEKLSQRVTIISVIIPCIIIAILVFVYMDITEKVVDVDQTQADQMAQVSQDLEVKLNALDVRIAKATHALDEKLAALESKRQALENRTAKMSAAKVDLEAMEAALAKLDKRIKANAAQDQSTLAAMERINQALLSSIDQNSSDFKAVSAQIKKEFRLFKEAFDARLLELSAYEQRIAQIVQDTGRLGKKLDALEKNTAASIDKKLDKNLRLLRQDLENQIAEVKKYADAANSTAKRAAAAAAAKAKTASTPEAPPKKSATTTSPTSTPKTQPPDSPFQKAPGAWGISEQDISQ
jgi:chromosome segregation ATPase